METTQELTRSQRAAEERMARNGHLRAQRTFREALEKGNIGRTRIGIQLSKSAVDGLAQILEERLTPKRAGQPTKAVINERELIEALGVRRTAWVSLQAAVHTASPGARTKTPTAQSVVTAIATALEDEYRLDQAKAEDYPGYAKLIKRVSKARPSVRERWIREGLSKAKEGPTPSRLPRSTKLALGQFILTILLTDTDIFTTKRGPNPTSKKKVRPLLISLSEEAMAWMVQAADRLGALFPVLTPCVQTPRDWTDPYHGGYYTDELARCLIIRGEAVADYLAPEHSSEVYEAINTLQRVPMEVNPAVWDVFSHSFEKDLAFGGMALREKHELPAKPTDEYGNPAPDGSPEWVEYRAAARKVHRANADKWSRVIVNTRLYNIAREHRNHPIFFPHRLDWRGRCYPMPQYLQPQGCDAAKGLLRFAEGKPIEKEEQADWLRIHLANTWGNDKVAFSERIEWVAQNESWIREVGKDPLGCRAWEDADEPWQFLAAAEDYGRFLEGGFGTESSVVVGMDGSCNGLQVYSLLSRHDVEGRATNCLPSDVPQDIYQQVADQAAVELAGFDKEDRQRVGREWLEDLGGEVPRSLAKRPVMTTPYGCTFHTIVRYVDEWRDENPGATRFGGFAPGASHTMALALSSAIQKVVHGAFECMAWLRQVADLCSKAGQEVRWMTPIGFPVQQTYYKMDRETVKTHFRGRCTLYRYFRDMENPEILRRKQADALPPNFVHSLDATAMMRTVLYARRAGVSNLSMVHDSYGTTAAEAPVLARELRNAWVDVFEGDPLQEFADQVKQSLPEGTELPETPEKGTLDIQEIKNSLYFFA